MTDSTARAVRFDRYGDREVLQVLEVAMPTAEAGEVVVAVRAAAINPGEAKIRTGALEEMFPTTFPCGQGSDLAGVVIALGEGVSGFAVGDEVLGFSLRRSSHASHLSVPVAQLIVKAPQLSWEAAGSVYVAGCTAYAAVRAIDPQPGETVAVSAATGGVGAIVVQLLAHRGVHVLGIASADSSGWLSAHGATPIVYGDGLAERLTAAAPDGIDAFIDLFGPDYVQLAADLGIAVDRIETIIAFAKAHELGAKSEGSETASTAEILAEVAGLIADGHIELPIAASYPLDQVREAFAELEAGHTHGKIVLIP